MKQKWVVKEETTLLEFLYKQFEGAHSKKGLKRLLDLGLCTHNSQVERFAKTPIAPGDKVILHKKPTPQKTETLFEDDHFLILSKPAGLICSPENFPDLYLIHRLDKDTTGVLMLAKSEEIKLQMIELFRQRKVHKRYIATVAGVLKKSQGSIHTGYTLAYSEGKAKRYRVSHSVGAKRALTRFEVLQRDKDSTKLYLYPITGRTHQLRVHMADLGHPILGDSIYGRHTHKGHIPLQLHAEWVSFPHPITGEVVSIQDSVQ